MINSLVLLVLIATRLKCTVVYIPRYTKNRCVINVCGVSGIECKIVYNNENE